MDKRRFGDTDEFFSLLGFGCMRFPVTADKAIDESAARDMLDYAIESGVNYIDTAYFYHEDRSEEFVGRSLAGRPRDSYYIATKLPMWLTENESDVERIFFEQLKRLGVDYIDHYLLHNLDSENAETARRYKAMEKLQRFKEQGLIRRIGMSFHDTAEVLKKHIAEFDVEFVYLQLNYMDWELQNAKGQYEAVTQAGLPVFVMEPVRGGGAGYAVRWLQRSAARGGARKKRRFMGAALCRVAAKRCYRFKRNELYGAGARQRGHNDGFQAAHRCG